MLTILNVDKQSKALKSGDVIHYLAIPEDDYEAVKADFTKASHLSVIGEVELEGCNGVYIKCDSLSEGYIAAIYLYKKYLATGEVFHEVTEDFEYEDYDDEYDPDEGDEMEDFLFQEGRLVHLPVVSSAEISMAYTNSHQPRPLGIGNFNMQMDQNTSSKEPYWLHGTYPIVVHEGYLKPDISESLRQFNRFIIFISVKERESEFYFHNEAIDSHEKKILFECDFELCDISKPSEKYYEMVLKDIVEKRGYNLSKSLKKTKLIEELKTYRGQQFAGNQDIELLVNKAIRKKRNHGKTLTMADFNKTFLITKSQDKNTQTKRESAIAEFDQLVGLEDIKQQLNRMVSKMIFHKERRMKGLKTGPIYCSAVFMGSPGTAKTTVARIFGKMLCQAGILDNERFIEVSRKDLIGKYVGHTAPLVSELFENYSGGTIFIDEAYSLMNEGRNDGYSAEAMSELIRQMENNPQTLVILAGYTDKMRNMIQYANPGLRSRLTNVIEFKDYSNDEMLNIFLHLLRKEDYKLEDIEVCKGMIRQFIDEIQGLGAENIGNGRLMRKLFQSAVGFMAERANHDMETLYRTDIEQAIKEIIKTERLVSCENERVVGFF